MEFVGYLASIEGAGSVVSGILATGLAHRMTELRQVALGLGLFAVGVCLQLGPRLAFVAGGAVLISVLDYRVLLAIMAAGLTVATVYAAVRLRPEQPAEVVDSVRGTTGRTR